MANVARYFLISMFLGVGVANAALTKLPLIPATVGMLGNEPQSLDPATICKSAMKANTYSVINSTFAATNAWYAAHLTGLKHTHVDAGTKGPEDGYYSADGSTLVIVLGRSRSGGVADNTYSVTYYTFQPGLPEKAINGILHDKPTC
jgi:hypothetical protein